MPNGMALCVFCEILLQNHQEFVTLFPRQIAPTLASLLPYSRGTSCIPLLYFPILVAPCEYVCTLPPLRLLLTAHILVIMKIIGQRVSHASVRNIDNPADAAREIQRGIMLLVGVLDVDTERQATWLAHKIAHARIFPSENNPQDHSLIDLHASVLSIPQFTLFAQLRHGNRPAHTRAGSPHHAQDLWQFFNAALRSEGLDVQTGFFGAHMSVDLTNDGPYTIIWDTEELGIA